MTELTVLQVLTHKNLYPVQIWWNKELKKLLVALASELQIVFAKAMFKSTFQRFSLEQYFV